MLNSIRYIKIICHEPTGNSKSEVLRSLKSLICRLGLIKNEVLHSLKMLKQIKCIDYVENQKKMPMVKLGMHQL